MQAIVRDITARRAAEQAIRESEERFRLLSEAAFEGIGISEDGRIVDCNEDLAAMLGYGREEMIGKAVLDFVVPEHAERVTERHRSESTERYEHVARRKDGSTFPVEVQGRSLPYQGPEAARQRHPGHHRAAALGADPGRRSSASPRRPTRPRACRSCSRRSTGSSAS